MVLLGRGLGEDLQCVDDADRRRLVDDLDRMGAVRQPGLLVDDLLGLARAADVEVDVRLEGPVDVDVDIAFVTVLLVLTRL
jgi:hypothetical protein